MRTDAWPTQRAERAVGGAAARAAKSGVCRGKAALAVGFGVRGGCSLLIAGQRGCCYIRSLSVHQLRRASISRVAKRNPQMCKAAPRSPLPHAPHVRQRGIAVVRQVPPVRHPQLPHLPPKCPHLGQALVALPGGPGVGEPVACQNRPRSPPARCCAGHHVAGYARCCACRLVVFDRLGQRAALR